MAAPLPSADEFFAQPKPTADEFFAEPAAPPAQYMGGAPEFNGMKLEDFPGYDPIGHVAGAMWQGIKEGFGSAPLGVSPETEKALRDVGIFNDVDSGHTSFLRSVNEAFMRPAAAAADSVWRAGGAAFGGFQAGVSQAGEEIGQPELGRDLAAIPESEFGSPHMRGAPEPGGLFNRDAAVADRIAVQTEARDRLNPNSLTALATTDRAWRTGETAADVPPGAPTAAQLGAPETPRDPASPRAPAETADQAPDIHETARSLAPEVFNGPAGYDALSQQRDTFRRWIDDLQTKQQADAEANAPHTAEIADLKSRMDDATPRMAKKYQARLDELEPANEAAIAEATANDSPDVARVRAELQKIDYRMRDLAPQVSDAYRRAQELLPEPEAPAEATPVAAETPPAGPAAAEAAQTEAAPVPANGADSLNVENEAQTGAALGSQADSLDPSVSGKSPQTDIAADVARKLTAAGRPADEAQAAGALVAAHYEARAARFGGTKGTASDLYTAEGPEIRAGRVRPPARVRELAQLGDPVKIIKGDEIAAPEADLKTLRAAARQFYDEKLKGTSVHSDALGKDVEFRGSRKAFSASANPDKLRLFAALPEIIAKGELVASEAPHLPELEKPTKAYHFIRAKVRIGDVDRDVGVTIREDSNGNLYYNHGLIEEGRSTPSAPQETARKAGPVGTGGGTALEQKVVPPSDDVNLTVGEPGGRRGVARGKIKLNEGRNVITLMKDADASTFIHETGHQWLEELVSDAADERAPADLKADAAAVRDWLGVKDGEAIPTKAHERFARGFENYMMEGRAPSQRLASVFAKFKVWLTKIYQTAAKLRSPISDDIRGVFDRMISTPEERTVIAPERAADSLVDRHNALAETTPPEQARDVAEVVREETDDQLDAKSPEVLDELGGRTEGGAPGSEGPGPKADGDWPAAGPDAREASSGAGRGGVDEGGGKAPAEGTGSRDAAGEPDDVSGSGAASRRSTESGVEDKAGNIRLENINMIEDAKAVIRQLAADNMDFNDARYGDPSWALYHQIKAAGEFLAQTATAAAEAFAKFKESKSDVDAMAYNQAAQRTLVAAEARAELTAGWGRAGHAFQRVDRIQAGLDIAEQIKRSTGKTLNQLLEEGDLFNELETPDQQAKFLFDSRASRWQKVRGGILSYFINNLISGPITHMAYSVGNTTWSLFKAIPVTTTAATIGAIREAAAGHAIERVHYNEVGAQLYGIIRGARDGLAAAGKALDSGVPFMKGANLTEMADLAKDLEKAGPKRTETLQARLDALQQAHEAGRSLAGKMSNESVRDQAIFPNSPLLGPVGRVLETPSRSVSAIHTVFYSVGYEQEIATRAYRAANLQGLEGDEHAAAVARFTSNPPAEDISAAHEEALKMVLMRRPKFDSFQGNLSRAINSNMAAKIIMPFMQIGANILREGLVDQTPLALLTQEGRDNLSGKNGEAARQIQTARIATGVAVSAAVVGLTAEGILTDSGPTDPKERRLKEATGWAPDSVRVGNFYVPYRKFLGPLGPLVATASNLYTVGHLLSDGDITNAAAHTMFGITSVVADETWMKGLTNFVDAARHWDTDGERYLRNLAVDFMPFAVGMGQATRMVDPVRREVHSMLDAARAHLPGLSQDLYPVRSPVTGMPVESHSMVSPRAAIDDPIIDALQRNGKFPAPVDRSILGVRLTPKQYDDYALNAGVLTTQMLKSQGVDQPGFAALPPFAQQQIIDKSFSQAREIAAKIVKAESVGTPDDIMAKYEKAKAANFTGGRAAKAAVLSGAQP